MISVLAVCLGLSTAVRAAERDGHSTLCAAALDRKNFLGAENVRIFSLKNENVLLLLLLLLLMMMLLGKDCRLQRYGPSDVVRCVDRLAQAVGRVDAPLRFVFVGDSRMRQQFYTFIAVSLGGHDPLVRERSVATVNRASQAHENQINRG